MACVKLLLILILYFSYDNVECFQRRKDVGKGLKYKAPSKSLTATHNYKKFLHLIKAQSLPVHKVVKIIKKTKEKRLTAIPVVEISKINLKQNKRQKDNNSSTVKKYDKKAESMKAGTTQRKFFTKSKNVNFLDSSVLPNIVMASSSSQSVYEKLQNVKTNNAHNVPDSLFTKQINKGVFVSGHPVDSVKNVSSQLLGLDELQTQNNTNCLNIENVNAVPMNIETRHNIHDTKIEKIYNNSKKVSKTESKQSLISHSSSKINDKISTSVEIPSNNVNEANIQNVNNYSKETKIEKSKKPINKELVSNRKISDSQIIPETSIFTNLKVNKSLQIRKRPVEPAVHIENSDFNNFSRKNLQNKNHNLSIIGGHTINIREAPFMAAVYLIGFGPYCGGSIIHEQYILTAAHCILANHSYQVLVGTDNLLHGGETYDVEKAVVHEDYNSISQFNDISLLKLSYKINFGEKVQKISLPKNDTLYDKDLVFVITGWGDTKSSGDPSDQLQQVHIHMVSRTTCNRIYMKKFYFITPKMLCAGGNGKDSCAGDSGGPLTLNGTQVGVVSFGAGCGVQPGVYTKVFSYLDWINNNIQINL